MLRPGKIQEAEHAVIITDTPRLTHFYVKHFQTYVILQNKILNGILEISAEFFHAGIKAPRDEGGGRILMAVVLRPIKFQRVVVWISAGSPTYTYIVAHAKAQIPHMPGLPGS